MAVVGIAEADRPPQSKKTCSSSGEQNVAAGGLWEDLNPELLALVLVRVPVEQRFGNAGLVCKSWMACVRSPFCWADIDIQNWCRRSDRSVDSVDSVVRKLVRRSRGTCRRLSAYKLGDAGFASASNCGRFLKVLQIPMSDVTDKMVERHVGSLANVTTLDISYCLKITCKGLGSFGKNCKSLVHLRRNMPPSEWDGSRLDDGEAMVIADTMPGLQHLELGFGCFGDTGLDAIVTKCKALTHLDIQGCRGVKLDGHLEDKCMELEVFRSPWIHDLDDYDIAGSSDDDIDEEGSSDEFSSLDMD